MGPCCKGEAMALRFFQQARGVAARPHDLLDAPAATRWLATYASAKIGMHFEFLRRERS
jgi:hypothetical protein